MARYLDILPLQKYYDEGYTAGDLITKFGFADASWAWRHGLKRRTAGQSRHVASLMRRSKIGVKLCEWCHKEHDGSFGSGRFCAEKCARRYAAKSTNYVKVSSTLIKLGAEGSIKYPNRKNRDPSYPERFFMQLFACNNFPVYEREFQVGKFFIDFAFIQTKAAVEIDGAFHTRIDVIAKDTLKDAYLMAQGWRVKRIPWCNYDAAKIQLILDDIKHFILQ
jgi:very-short-patch-repair endonuclease